MGLGFSRCLHNIYIGNSENPKMPPLHKGSYNNTQGAQRVLPYLGGLRPPNPPRPCQGVPSAPRQNLPNRYNSYQRCPLNLSHISTSSDPLIGISWANAASGMAVHDDCKLRFLELKAKRTYRFVIYKIDEKLKQVVVEKLGEPTLGYEDFTASLPENECRYAIYDFDFVTEENCQKSKIFFIAWSPDTSKVRSKMLYASSKDRFKRELDGIQVELQATDATEIGMDVIKGRAN